MSTRNTKRKQTSVYRLAKPVQKGFFGLLFSRFMVVLLLILLQLSAYLVGFVLLEVYLPNFAVIRAIFLVAMVIYLFNCPMDSSAKLTWLLIISLFPIPGALVLAFSRTALGYRKLRKNVNEQVEATKKAIPKDRSVLQELKRDGSGTDDLSRYLNRSGCFPIFNNTEATYYPSGEAFFEDMLKELDKAEKYIFLEYFIIEEGYMWGEILQILHRKAKEGVDVRVMYDGLCEISQLPTGYTDLLAEHKIRAKVFAPIHARLSTHYNYRDHRKILAIDGKVAFTGGVNLADEYINQIERFGHWKDTAVRLRGAAAKSLTLMFLQMWNLDEEHPLYEPYLDDEGYVPDGANGYVMPYCDTPMDDMRVGETVYIDMLYRATDYVHIMTPYLILDDELKTALTYAAQRGVDVKLILPGIPDKKGAYALAKSHYRDLLQAGVKIYEYTPGFVHAKVVIADGKKAVVGTINMDYRSLYHHFECAAYLYKTSCIPEIEADYLETLKKCRTVSRDTIRREKLSVKIRGSLMKFIAPLM